MNKQLLHYDEASANWDINHINKRVIPDIENTLMPLFSELQIGPLTNEYFIDLINGGKDVENAVIKSVETGLGKNGINNRKVIANLIGEALEAFPRVVSVIEKMKIQYHDCSIRPDGKRNNLLNYISFQKGSPFISDDHKAALRETYKVYCKTQSGQDLRALHLKAVAACNDFFTELRNAGTGIYHLGQVFTIKDINGNISVEPSVVNYDNIVSITKGREERDRSISSRQKEQDPELV
jgi:hypothetical protein